MDSVQVKGRAQAVRIYEVLHSDHPFAMHTGALARYQEAYELYLQREFARAETIFSALHEDFPDDKASIRMQENCKTYLKTPPPEDWDGVTIFTSK